MYAEKRDRRNGWPRYGPMQHRNLPSSLSEILVFSARGNTFFLLSNLHVFRIRVYYVALPHKKGTERSADLAAVSFPSTTY